MFFYSRVSTLSLLDNRLRRIETLLETSIPQLIGMTQSKLASHSSIPHLNDKSQKKASRKSRKPRYNSSEHGSYNNDNSNSVSASESLSEFDHSESFSESSDSNSDEDVSGSDDEVEVNPRTPGNDKQMTYSHSRIKSKLKQKLRPKSASNISKPSSAKMSWDVPDPPVAHTLYFNDPPAQNSKLKPNGSDLTEITIHNSFSQFFVECLPLMFCSPVGFNWISSKINDPGLMKRVIPKFNNLHEHFKHGIIDLSNASSVPTDFDKEIVFMAIEAYFQSFTGIFMYSFKEIDNIVFKEFGERLPFDGSQYEIPDSELKDPFNRTAADFGGDPKTNPHPNELIDGLYEGDTVTGFNGYAEKLAIAAITAIGILLLCFDKKEFRSSKTNQSICHELATRYTLTAKIFFEKYSFVGNSVIGIKGIVSLLLLVSASVNIKPAMTISAVGARLAQEVGLHREEAYARVPVRETILRINTWWMLYCLEKDSCVKHCRPSCFDDRDISAPLPLEFPLTPSTPATEPFNVLASLVSLNRIRSRINFDISSPTVRLTVKEHLVKLVQYERELEAWKSTVPVAYCPDASSFGPIFGPNPRPSSQNIMFRHLVYYCHIYYFSIVCSLYRQVANHPSWIYRFTTADDGLPNSNNTTPATAASSVSNSSHAEDDKKHSSKAAKTPGSDTENIPSSSDLKDFDPATVVSLLKEAQEAHARGKMKRSFTLNGVKLIVRRIAVDNPILLRSRHLWTAASRRTIQVLLETYPWTFVPLWQLAFFGFSAYVDLFVVCMLSPLEEKETLDNLAHLQSLVEMIEQLYANTEEYLFQFGIHSMLHDLTDSLVKYVQQRRSNANMESKEVPDLVPFFLETQFRKDREEMKSHILGSLYNKERRLGSVKNLSSTDLASVESTPSYQPGKDQNLSKKSDQKSNQTASKPAYSPPGGLDLSDYSNSDFQTPQPFAQFQSPTVSGLTPQQTQYPISNSRQPVSFAKPNNSNSNKTSVSTPGSTAGIDTQSSSSSFSNSFGMSNIKSNSLNMGDPAVLGTHTQTSSHAATQILPNSSQHIPTANDINNINNINNIPNLNNININSLSHFGNMNDMNSVPQANSLNNIYNFNPRLGEPMLDYLYPDFELGTDMNICSNLFFSPGPTWVGASGAFSTGYPATTSGPQGGLPAGGLPTDVQVLPPGSIPPVTMTNGIQGNLQANMQPNLTGLATGPGMPLKTQNPEPGLQQRHVNIGNWPN